MRRHPATAIYNPDLLTKQGILSTFVARKPLLEGVLDDLRLTKPGETTQHHLIVGSPGMGKTTFLRRLRYAIEDDPVLGEHWIPLAFPEEQYNVFRLSDLWVNCLRALGDALEERGRQAAAAVLAEKRAAIETQGEPERARAALELLTSWSAEEGRGLVLLLDNVDLVLYRLREHHWAIREILSVDPHLVWIGASAAAVEATYRYDEAFYDFFRTHELRGLSEEEGARVLARWAKVRATPDVARVLAEDPGRFAALHLLTGGSPRTLVLMYNVLALDGQSTAGQDLERLLDLTTPRFKARFESLPAQAQLLVDALAQNWDPMTAGALAAVVRLDVNSVSAQLTRLTVQGVVEKVAYPPKSKAAFQVSERLFNIWYLMRASKTGRQRLLWLVEFLRMTYRTRRPEPAGPPREWAVIAAILRERLDDHGRADGRWLEVLALVDEAVRGGQAGHAGDLLDELGYGEPWRPLREALRALAEGDLDGLARLAPEVRRPAEELYATLARERAPEKAMRAERRKAARGRRNGAKG